MPFYFFLFSAFDPKFYLLLFSEKMLLCEVFNKVIVIVEAYKKQLEMHISFKETSTLTAVMRGFEKVNFNLNRTQGVLFPSRHFTLVK